jgi:hypothetical protein
VQQFDAEIVAADGGGAYVCVPDAVITALGGKRRILVRASFDGIPYEGTIVSMGGEMILGVLRAIRSELGKGPGDRVAVTVERYEGDRVIAVPDDVRAALHEAGVEEVFDALSYTHKREYVSWIDEAKKPETRARRVHKTIERLQA